MYSKGMTTRQISDTLEDIYGFEASEVYPDLYINAIHYSVRDNGMIHKLAAYVILGINLDGRKEVLTIQVGDNEKFKVLTVCFK